MFGIERILVCPTLALARPLVVMSEAATPFDHGSAYDRRIFLTPPPLAATLSGLCPIKGIAAAVDSQRSSGRSFLVSTPVLARSLPRAGLARAGSTTRRRPHRVSSSRHGSVSLGLLAVRVGSGVCQTREIGPFPVASCCLVPSTNGAGELMASTPLRGDNNPDHAVLPGFTCTP